LHQGIAVCNLILTQQDEIKVAKTEKKLFGKKILLHDIYAQVASELQN
jgi:hypothetical protein